MEKFVYLENVVTLELDAEKCVGCGMCLEVCPHAVFAMNNGKAQIADRNACMECGACATNCPAEALSVEAGEGCAVAILNEMLGRGCTCEPNCC